MGLFDERSYSYNTTKSITELDTSSKEMEKEVEKIQSDPFSGGSPGLVPESTSDTQDKYLRGDGTWHTPTGGGGGGTENYEDLVNKPAIDGTELDKTSTAEGLGLAKRTDLPDMSDVVHDDDLEPYAKKTDLPTVPTKVSELQNDSGYITDYTETDPTVPSWAKAENKPTYSKSDVGLSNVDNTSDANKPVSTPQQAALDLKQDKLTAGDGIDISAQNVISLNPTFGFTPVGTIISVMGNAAPTNYLACNGQTVNIADYPELAAYFEAQFGSKNQFGGDGITTFGVPDLRGEFLRGTGTNGHSGEGSGSNVGVHQDATKHLAFFKSKIDSGDIRIQLNSSSDTDTGENPSNVDARTESRLSFQQIKFTTNTANTSANSGRYASRPTNTSVLYCIATKNIYLNPALDYSTSEKVVGYWIDGKPLYQKTVSINLAFADKGNINFASGIPENTVDTVVNIQAMGHATAGSTKYWRNIPIIQDSDPDVNSTIQFNIDNSKFYIYSRLHDNTNWTAAHVTIQYTKSTD